MSLNVNWDQRGKIRYMTSAYISLHGDFGVNMAKDIGANLTLLAFTGTAGEREHWKWRSVKPFVQKANDAGINVGFYMKLTNLNWNPMFEEIPESKDWIMVYRDGSPALYLGDPDRYMGCLNNPGWRQYLKDMITSAVEHNANGLFYDNYFIPRPGRGLDDEAAARAWACYCDTCRELFGPYTEKKLGWACDLPDDPVWDDPVWQAFIEFRDDTIAEVTRINVAHAKSLNPDIKIYPNVCPPWFGGGGAKGSVTAQLADIVDILLFEGNQQPRLERGGGLPRAHTAAVDWKYATALTSKPILYRAHQPDKVTTADETRMGIAEGFAFGGSYQNVVAGHLAAEPYRKKAVTRYYSFFKKHEDRYTDVEDVADVGLLVSQPTINWYHPDRAARGSGLPQTIQGASQALYELHVPFNVVLDRALAESTDFRMLLAPNVACMSDEQAEAIATFVEGGGGLIATGVTSLYDERYRRRDDYALAEVFGVHHGQKVDSIVKTSYGRGRCAYLTGTPEEVLWDEGLQASRNLIGEALAYALGDDTLIEVDAPLTTGINLTEKGDSTLLHLLNYEETAPPQDIAVRLRKRTGMSVDKVTVLSPDFDGPVAADVTDDGGHASFTVPHLELYDLVVVDWK